MYQTSTNATANMSDFQSLNCSAALLSCCFGSIVLSYKENISKTQLQYQQMSDPCVTTRD